MYTVEVVPAEGKPTSKEVEIPATGTSVGEALKAAGISHENMQLSINGRPVTLDHHIKPNQRLKAEKRKIVATERTSGS